jgi:hypothetical protein
MQKKKKDSIDARTFLELSVYSSFDGTRATTLGYAALLHEEQLKATAHVSPNELYFKANCRLAQF